MHFDLRAPTSQFAPGPSVMQSGSGSSSSSSRGRTRPKIPSADSTALPGTGAATLAAVAVMSQRRQASHLLRAAAAGKSARQKKTLTLRWLGLLRDLLMWTVLYIWFTRSVDMVNVTAKRFPKWEIPLYLIMAVVPAYVAFRRFVERAMQQLFSGLSRVARSPVLSHTLLTAALPFANAIDSILVFLGVNFASQALPKGVSISTPRFLGFIDPNQDGVLTTLEIQLGIQQYSLRILKAVFVTCFCTWFLRAKKPPESYNLSGNTVVDSFWRGIKERRGWIVLFDLAMTGSALSLVALRWFRAFGISPQTVLAFGGVGGIALGFAAQTLVENIISGLLILVTRPFCQGDWIECEEIRGYVRNVSWTLSEVETTEGPIVTIPNSTLIQAKTTNRTVAETRLIRFELPLPAKLAGSYQDVLDTLSKISADILADSPLELVKSPPSATLTTIDRDNENAPIAEVRVRVKNNSTDAVQKVRSDLMVATLNYVQTLDAGAD